MRIKTAGGTARVITSVLLALALATLLNYCSRDRNRKIGFVVTTLSNPYFVTMTEAAKGEIKGDSGFELVIQAPEQAVNVARQVDIVENLISQRVNALAIVPADSKGIIPAIAKANAANIPVLILDNKIDKAAAAQAGVHTVTFIGSDNVAGGRLAGEYMIKKLPQGGDVAILEGVSGVDAAIDRKAGFLAALSSDPRLKVVASQPADWDREKGLNIFQNILQAHPNIKGVFACNDEMALGAIQAIRAAGKEGQIVVIGFDAIKDALDAIRKGEMDATVQQLPGEVGRLGVKYAVEVVNHQAVPPVIPTEVKLITADKVASFQ
jgi:ribose transport system substrate-binding protein